MPNPHGIIAKNVAGLYNDPSTDSELITQAIMGQSVEIQDENADWLHVRTWDTYNGWVKSKWVCRAAVPPSESIEVTSLFTDALKAPCMGSEIWTKLVITTKLELVGYEGALVHVRLPDNRETWLAQDDIMPLYENRIDSPTGAGIIRTAKRFMGVPYLWGGSSPFGIDCSGFTQLAYRLNGISLLRNSYMQANDPRAIEVDKADLVAGDLVFFASGKDAGKITHVGMACGGGTFIHSAGGGAGVDINNLDDEPYSRIYWGARRIPNVA